MRANSMQPIYKYIAGILYVLHSLHPGSLTHSTYGESRVVEEEPVDPFRVGDVAQEYPAQSVRDPHNREEEGGAAGVDREGFLGTVLELHSL